MVGAGFHVLARPTSMVLTKQGSNYFVIGVDDSKPIFSHYSDAPSHECSRRLYSGRNAINAHKSISEPTLEAILDY
jgi:hypothetical protein